MCQFKLAVLLQAYGPVKNITPGVYHIIRHRLDCWFLKEELFEGKGAIFDAFWEGKGSCFTPVLFLTVHHCEISNTSDDDIDTIFCLLVFCHLQESSGSKGKAGKSKKSK